MVSRLSVLIALAALSGAAGAVEIVRCKAPGGGTTYQPAPCGEREEESRPRIPSAYPERNVAESQRIFEREAALDRRLEARRDRELQEQQMREARAERAEERQRLELLAAQAQPQYLIAYPALRGYGPARPVHHLPRQAPQPIRR
jgi:hypothetical protein